MKILIVGGNSSLGLALKTKLSQTHTVITAGRKHCDLALDLANDISNIILPSEIDVIIHTVAHFGGKKAEEIYAAEQINVLGTLKLCEAAANAGVKHFIFISSIFAGLPADAPNYSAYAMSKRQAEEVATYFCKQFELPLTIVRPSHLYGVQPALRNHQPFFYNLLDQARRGENINLYGTNDPVRNYLFVDDLCEIIERVASKQLTGLFPCTFLKDVTYSEIARTAYSVFKTVGQVNFLRDKPNIPSFSYEKSDDLYHMINFFPKIDLESGIRIIANSGTN